MNDQSSIIDFLAGHGSRAINWRIHLHKITRMEKEKGCEVPLTFSYINTGSPNSVGARWTLNL